MQKKNLKWTETCFSSCYFSYILFQARLTNEISASLSIYTTLPSARRRKALRRPLGRRGAGACRGGRPPAACFVLCYVQVLWQIAVESYIAIVISTRPMAIQQCRIYFSRKTPLRKPFRGEGIVSTKPRPKSVYDFLGSVYCFIVLSCVWMNAFIAYDSIA